MDLDGGWDFNQSGPSLVEPSGTYIQIIANLKRSDDPDALHVLWQNSYLTETISQLTSVATRSGIPDPSYPGLVGEDATLSGNIAGNTDLYATDSIFISSNTSFSTTGPIRIVAGRVIAVEPGTSIPPNVELITAEVIPVCQADWAQATQSEINSLCSSSTYQGKAALKQASPSLRSYSSLSLTAHPTANRLTLRYKLPEKVPVSLTLYDLTDRPVLLLQAEPLTAAGPQELTVDLSTLAAGMYQVILQAGEQRQGVKVVKTE